MLKVKITNYLVQLRRSPRSSRTVYQSLDTVKMISKRHSDSSSKVIKQMPKTKEVGLRSHSTPKQKEVMDGKTTQQLGSTYELGNMVMVNSNCFTNDEKSSVLDSTFLGPFRISGIFPETSVYQLETISPVDESSLRPFIPEHKQVRQRAAPLEPKPIVPEDDQFIVSDILDCRQNGRSKEYLVRWEGYSDKHNQWVKKNDISPVLVKEFHSRLGRGKQ